MNEFKQMLDADIDEVFVDLDEFADTHILNEIECPCVIQNPTEQAKFQSAQAYEGYEGVHGASLIVYVKAEFLADNMPIEGNRFDVDGKIYQVAALVEQDGLLTVELKSYSTGWNTFGS